MEYVVGIIILYFIIDNLRRSDVMFYPNHGWMKHRNSANENETLCSILMEYDRIDKRIHEIDFRQYYQPYVRPRYFITSWLNYLGFSSELKKLIKEREKLKNDYLLMEKMLFGDSYVINRKYSSHGGIFTIL